MQAVQYTAYRGPIAPTDLPEPECPDDGAVIRVAATGVCRSDWHAWQGHDPVPLPMVPGHEFAGEVVAVGPQVRRVRVGEQVTVPFACGCGRCEWCARGATNVCPQQTQPGFTRHGSFAELVAVEAADTNVIALPPGLDAGAAAALGCRFATAYRGVQLAALQAGETFLVAGCGGVGLSAIAIGRAAGARVIGVDPSPAARDAALALGADSAVASLSEVDSDPDVTMDALGRPDVLAGCVELLRPQGRHAQVGLLLGDQSQAALPMGRVVAKELQVLGVHGLAAADYPAMLQLAATLDLAQLVHREIPLAEAPAALAALGTPGQPAGITVVRP